MELEIRDDFRAALAAYSQERRQQRRHATLPELAAYHQGTLTHEQREEIAEHVAVCEDCSVQLLFGVIEFDDGGGQRANSEIEVEEAWNRLLPRLKTGNGTKSSSPLSRLLAAGALPIEQALPIGLQVGRALVELHASGFLHRDLRAESVLVEPDGKINLLDLGMVAIAESLEIDSSQARESAAARVYRALSPEQVAGELVSLRSDLFSFGVLLYEMLTGESPFQDSTQFGTFCRILSLDPLPANELNLAVTPALASLIDRLLAKEPQDRPQSAAAVVSELEVLTNGSVPSSVGGEIVESRSVEEQIEGLYDEIIALTREASADDLSCGEEIDRKWAHLLELQQAEAAQFRERFETGLNMPIDAGQQILDRAAVLREEVADLISANRPAAAADVSEPVYAEREYLEDSAAADSAAEEADVASAPAQTY